MIPAELKLFSVIYEYGRYLTILLAAGWFLCALHLMLRQNRWFWLWLGLLPCVILPCHISFTWCGYHYRMELRDRYAVDRDDLTDPWARKNVNINRMPPELRAEYAKHDYHPRARDMKAQALFCIVIFPFVYFAGGLAWLVTVLVSLSRKKRKHEEELENP